MLRDPGKVSGGLLRPAVKDCIDTYSISRLLVRGSVGGWSSPERSGVVGMTAKEVLDASQLIIRLPMATLEDGQRREDDRPISYIATAELQHRTQGRWIYSQLKQHFVPAGELGQSGMKAFSRNRGRWIELDFSEACN